MNFSGLLESEIQANFVKQKYKGKSIEPNEPQYNTLNCMSVHKQVSVQRKYCPIAWG